MNVPVTRSVSIEIENPAGENIYRKELKGFSGFSAQQLDLSGQSWGIYLVSVSDGTNKFVKKIVVR